MTCKTCNSDRCGNQAACARKKAAEAKAYDNFLDFWACLALIGLSEAGLMLMLAEEGILDAYDIAFLDHTPVMATLRERAWHVAIEVVSAGNA